MGKKIQVQKPSTGDEELNLIEEVLKSGWLGLGSKVKEFEDELRKFLEADFVIAVNTGTSALHLSLDALGITKGDEVILPSLTFVATAQAVSATGARPVFCDVNETTLNLDPDDIETHITEKTKAIIPVH